MLKILYIWTYAMNIQNTSISFFKKACHLSALNIQVAKLVNYLSIFQDEGSGWNLDL